MDRAEAIKVLETEITCAKQETCERIECEKCELVMPLEKVLGAFGMAIAALREQEQLARNSHDVATPCKWISVEKRLPEVGKTVLTLDKRGHINDRYTYKCADGVAVFTAEYLTSSKDITHWMPLPEPPKEGV